MIRYCLTKINNDILESAILLCAFLILCNDVIKRDERCFDCWIGAMMMKCESPLLTPAIVVNGQD